MSAGTTAQLPFDSSPVREAPVVSLNEDIKQSWRNTHHTAPLWSEAATALQQWLEVERDCT